jgi:hypothetical protein
MAEPIALKYRAFISYSHADTTWAKWLHRALESFCIDKDLVGLETATGAIPKALRPIFRDRDEFTRWSRPLGPNARRARCLPCAHRHLIAGFGQEPLRQRGSPPLQVAAPRATGDPADRGLQAG